MNLIRPRELESHDLPGRSIRKAVGAEGRSRSGSMTAGYARYAAEYGPMEPHRHAEETLYVVGAERGWVRFGPAPDSLGPRVDLEAGMILHVPELEWHAFGFEPGGFVEVVFFYATVDNIRPEQAGASR